MTDLDTNLFGEPLLRRSASFIRPGVRRLLMRHWGPGPRALVIGCNPSMADAKRDDPTSLWWNDWFRLYGFGRYDAANLYPFCTSSPDECRKRVHWALNGPAWDDRDDLLANLDMIAKLAKRADQVFVCWGAIAWDSDWIEHVVEHIQTGEEPYPDLWCWGKTKAGAPTHPMARGKHRIAKDQAPILWRAA